MKNKAYSVVNSYNEVQGAILFDETVPYAKRIEITELVRQSEFDFVEITEEEYQISKTKFEI